MRYVFVCCLFVVIGLGLFAQEDKKQADKVKKPLSHQLRMIDGSSINGVLKNKEISIKTRFGTLVVPVSDVVSIVPGLKSHPHIKKEIEELVAKLSHIDKKIQIQAFAQLGQKSPKHLNLLKKSLEKCDKQKQKKAIQKINEIIENYENFLDDLGDKERASYLFIEEDRMVSKTFEIIGKVMHTSFGLKSQYGDLEIKLTDLKKLVTSDDDHGRQAIKKNITVAAEDNQFRYKETGISVKVGDRIKISASGSIQIPNWGYSTGPEGNANNMGMTNGFSNGTLVARVGKEGNIKIGRDGSFVVKKSGKLTLAVMMNPRFLGNGTQGSYSVQVKVRPEDAE